MKQNQRMCFVLMPFSEQFKNQWELAFVPAIEDSGLVAFRGDAPILGTNMIMKDVTRCIYESDLIIAELTGRNPNVMYELGLAHAAKKKVIMLSQNDSDIPFDLRHIRYLIYSGLDLVKLRNDLKTRVMNTISQTPEDFFPELKLLTRAEIVELNYLRENARYLDVTVVPQGSDIFFNGKLIGQGKVRIRVNSRAEKNTLSFSAVQMFEKYIDITKDDLDRGHINIQLDPIQNEADDLNKRVPYFLRFRSRDPDNPVLMKAICSYLWRTGALNEAAIEAEELVNIAPTWPMALYTAAIIYSLRMEYEKSDEYQSRAIALNPKLAIPYIGFACDRSIQQNGDEALKYLKIVADDEQMIRQVSEWGYWKCSTEKDFDFIRNDSRYKDDFNAIVKLIEGGD